MRPYINHIAPTATHNPTTKRTGTGIVNRKPSKFSALQSRKAERGHGQCSNVGVINNHSRAEFDLVGGYCPRCIEWELNP